MMVCNGTGREDSEFCEARLMARRTGDFERPLFGTVLDREAEVDTREVGTSWRLGFREGAAFRESTLIEDLLSGTSRRGRLMALVARLPSPIKETFLPTGWFTGVARSGEELASRCRTGVLGSSFTPSIDIEGPLILGGAALEESDTSLISDK